MQNIATFFAAKSFAVAGASKDRGKYGNMVFRALVDSGRLVYPLNPTATEIEGHQAYPTLASLPSVPESLSIVTPPSATRDVVTAAVAAGVKNIWMQPGSQDEIACQAAIDAGINLISHGECVLVALAAR